MCTSTISFALDSPKNSAVLARGAKKNAADTLVIANLAPVQVDGS